MNELNKEANKIIMQTEEEIHSDQPTQADLDELKLKLNLKKEQLQQEIRLKQNFNQENIWLKFLNKTLNDDIKVLTEQIKQKKIEI